MKKRLPLVLSLTMIIYFCLVLFTPFSLTGFWTDLIFTILLVGFSVYLNFKTLIPKGLIKIVFIITTLIAALYVSGLILVYAINPFSWNVLKTDIVEITVKGSKTELEYFKPVGAWGCGYGYYWITETFTYFPLIEYTTYYNNCTHDNWGYYSRTGKWE